MDNLYGWTNRAKPIWVWIEASNFNGQAPSGQPNEAQIYAEVWIALTHNARGIGYVLSPFLFV